MKCCFFLYWMNITTALTTTSYFIVNSLLVFYLFFLFVSDEFVTEYHSFWKMTLTKIINWILIISIFINHYYYKFWLVILWVFFSNLKINVYIKFTNSFWLVVLYGIFINSSTQAGYDIRSIFKWSLTGSNSEFSSF